MLSIGAKALEGSRLHWSATHLAMQCVGWRLAGLQAFERQIRVSAPPRTRRDIAFTVASLASAFVGRPSHCGGFAAVGMTGLQADMRHAALQVVKTQAATLPGAHLGVGEAEEERQM